MHMKNTNKNNKSSLTGQSNQGLFKRLAGAQQFKALFPKSLKQRARQWLQRLFPLDVYDSYHWEANDQYADAEEISSYTARVDVRLGIIKELTRLHGFYIGACRELGVPYKLVDISGPDWIDA